MKTINLFFYLMLLLLTLSFSCSNSDDEGASENTLEQQFIGTWQPLKFVVVCSTGSVEEEIYTTCEGQGRLTVNGNGTWSETYFYEYIDDNCESDGESSGVWEIIEEKLIVTEIGFSEIEIDFFQVNNNVLQLGQYDDEFPCDGDKPSSHYYMEYAKVN